MLQEQEYQHGRLFVEIRQNFSFVEWGLFRNYQQHLTHVQENYPFRKQLMADSRIISQLSNFNIIISVHSTLDYAIYSTTSINRHPIFRRFLITVMLASHCVTGVGGKYHSSLSHGVKWVINIAHSILFIFRGVFLTH